MSGARSEQGEAPGARPTERTQMYVKEAERPATKPCDAYRPAHLAGALLLAILLVASLAFAQAPAYRLRGRILDETGIPVAHAALSWRSAAGETYRAASDLAGRFVSPPLPPGAYQLTVEKPGFFRLETAVTVAAAAPPLAYTLVHERSE